VFRRLFTSFFFCLRFSARHYCRRCFSPYSAMPQAALTCRPRLLLLLSYDGSDFCWITAGTSIDQRQRSCMKTEDEQPYLRRSRLLQGRTDATRHDSRLARIFEFRKVFVKSPGTRGTRDSRQVAPPFEAHFFRMALEGYGKRGMNCGYSTSHYANTAVKRGQ